MADLIPDNCKCEVLQYDNLCHVLLSDICWTG